MRCYPLLRVCVEDGITRKYDISTLSVDTWHVISSASSSSPSLDSASSCPPSDITDGSGRLHLSGESSGQFHAADAYVVRWRYRKEQVGWFPTTFRSSKGHSKLFPSLPYAYVSLVTSINIEGKIRRH